MAKNNLSISPCCVPCRLSAFELDNLSFPSNGNSWKVLYAEACLQPMWRSHVSEPLRRSTNAKQDGEVWEGVNPWCEAVWQLLWGDGTQYCSQKFRGRIGHYFLKISVFFVIRPICSLKRDFVKNGRFRSPPLFFWMGEGYHSLLGGLRHTYYYILHYILHYIFLIKNFCFLSWTPRWNHSFFSTW